MRIFPLLFLLSVFVEGALSQAPHVHSEDEMHGRHRDSSAYLSMLEAPSRDEYQKPEEVVAALALRPGEVIADIGAGSGYFALRLARGVGRSGRVYAVDINPDFVLFLNRRLRDEGLTNVFTVLAEPDDPLLPPNTVDRFFICNTWHHIDRREVYLDRIRESLKPGGQVVMIDFEKRELPVGPPMSMKIARDELVRQMTEAGFHLSGDLDLLPYQYFLVFTLAPAS
jgi:arsenite methyltransferase